MSDKRDFFISYNVADEAQAEWISWTLEESGYKTVIEKWDFKAGGNFALEMDRAMKTCDRIIVVLSPNYLDARYTHPEWAGYFANDPQGYKRLVVPVRIAECDPEGLIQAMIYIDLVGMDQAHATKEILARLVSGRAKPEKAPAFPGFGSKTRPVEGPVRVSDELEWTPLDQTVDTLWRRDQSNGTYQTATLELHTICIGGPRLSSKVFRELEEDLSTLARKGGLFLQQDSIAASTTEDRVLVSDGAGWGSRGGRGMTVDRNRRLSTWAPLPQASLGSIFDEEEIRARIQSFIAMHVQSGLMAGDFVSFAVSVEPITMLQIGSVAELKSRTSASMTFSMGVDSARVEAQDAVPLDTVATHLAEISDELTSRLLLRLESRKR